MKTEPFPMAVGNQRQLLTQGKHLELERSSTLQEIRQGCEERDNYRQRYLPPVEKVKKINVYGVFGRDKQGIMQTMPKTFAVVSRKSKFIEGALAEPRWNIAAGIWYNNHQFDHWQKGRGL